MSKQVLKINKLCFSYDNKKILDNISVEFFENSITGILGKNGSGKSTLLECIMRFKNNYNGNILLFDKDIKQYSVDDLAKKITYLPQNFDRKIEFKVKDFLLFGRAPYLSVSSAIKNNDYEKINLYSKKTRIEQLLDKQFNELSGGEQKLVLITKILMQETEVILLDEPTDSLDFGNQYKILELLKLLHQEGKTIIFTIHNPNQLIEFDYNTVLISNSRIIANGLAKEVINEDVIKSIYGDMFVAKENIFIYKKNKYSISSKKM